MQLTQLTLAAISLMVSVDAMSLFAVHRNDAGESEVVLDKRYDAKAIEPMQKRTFWGHKGGKDKGKGKPKWGFPKPPKGHHPKPPKGHPKPPKGWPFPPPKNGSFPHNWTAPHDWVKPGVSKRFDDADEALAEGKARLFY